MKARELAAQRGEIFYFPENPCKRGHMGKRYVSSGNCYECLKFHRRRLISLMAGTPELVTPVHEEYFAPLRKFTDALMRREPAAISMLILFDAGQPNGRT